MDTTKEWTRQLPEDSSNVAEYTPVAADDSRRGSRRQHMARRVKCMYTTLQLRQDPTVQRRLGVVRKTHHFAHLFEREPAHSATLSQLLHCLAASAGGKRGG